MLCWMKSDYFEGVCLFVSLMFWSPTTKGFRWTIQQEAWWRHDIVEGHERLNTSWSGNLLFPRTPCSGHLSTQGRLSCNPTRSRLTTTGLMSSSDCCLRDWWTIDRINIYVHFMSSTKWRLFNNINQNLQRLLTNTSFRSVIGETWTAFLLSRY